MRIPLVVDDPLENLLKLHFINETVILGVENGEERHYVFQATGIGYLEEVYSKQKLVLCHFSRLKNIKKSKSGVLRFEHYSDFLLEVIQEDFSRCTWILIQTELILLILSEKMELTVPFQLVVVLVFAETVD